ncbi:relaxase/mobilization nuclease domain-containing protein [Steroidobacter sp. S1-65]|uniref:Relaxase/mobilization nuclease domain-containing protein n=1 Tax=Steroidobacter gossypii TaxID=2805490 RepID=A0ABS1WY26_9GAMM|nr:relaxase/mobilization nuclease domain-containing protein [Steroidobacter gossypii]MBM0105879.1 relaxase/mobilization nuclease domain-containing protein [Steroidobacter gossypii]
MKTFRLDGGEPWLDIGSHGRAGSGKRMYLSPAQIALIGRTVSRTPEVMVKVTSGRGSSSSRGVAAHFDYIGRRGDLEIETDDGERLVGKDAGQQIIRDWDLDMDEDRKHRDLFAFNRRKPPKLVHKIIFSMPAGTPPKKVLAAVHDFAREEFGRKHRYAMVLHTDEPHPHVHVVVKAVSEAGVRLNISKETLRHWRSEFARQLRGRGVAANATTRSVRGQSRTSKLDSIFRAAQRGESSHMATRVRDVVRELRSGALDQSGTARLQRTRREIVRGWHAVRDLLAAEGRHQLADRVSRFVDQMPPPRTDKQWLAADLIEQVREPSGRDKPLVR